MIGIIGDPLWMDIEPSGSMGHGVSYMIESGHKVLEIVKLW